MGRWNQCVWMSFATISFLHWVPLPILLFYLSQGTISDADVHGLRRESTVYRFGNMDQKWIKLPTLVPRRDTHNEAKTLEKLKILFCMPCETLSCMWSSLDLVLMSFLFFIYKRLVFLLKVSAILANKKLKMLALQKFRVAAILRYSN